MSERPVRLAASLAVAGALHCTLNAALLRRPRATTTDVPDVPVLIPARNEAARIAPCLRAVVGQDGVAEVIVLDDASDDGTATVSAALGARVVAGSPVPEGWLGKSWACAQLMADVHGEVVVFVDADVRLEPGAVRSAVELLLSSGLDVLCPFPRQLAGTLGEQLLQPLLAWSWLTMLPVRLAERSARPSLTAACGQFVVVRRSALERAGGFGAVRDQVLDDLALVRAIKAAGGRGGIVDGSSLASCRMYEGWAALRDGYGKSLWTAFGSPGRAVAVIAGLAFVYVLPPWAMVRGSKAGTLGYLAGVTSRVVASRVSGAGFGPAAFAHPLSVLALAGLTLDSSIRHRRGRLTWRGRPIVPTS